MLLELLARLFFGVAGFLLDMIPSIELNADFLGGFEDVRAVMAGAAYLLPVKTLLGCLAVFFLLHNTTLIISIINWVIRKIPTIS